MCIGIGRVTTINILMIDDTGSDWFRQLHSQPIDMAAVIEDLVETRSRYLF